LLLATGNLAQQRWQKSPDVTDVWISIYGSNVNVDQSGNVLNITDAQSILGVYQSRCSELGLDCSKVIIDGAQNGPRR